MTPIIEAWMMSCLHDVADHVYKQFTSRPVSEWQAVRHYLQSADIVGLLMWDRYRVRLQAQIVELTGRKVRVAILHKHKRYVVESILQ